MAKPVASPFVPLNAAAKLLLDPIGSEGGEQRGCASTVASGKNVGQGWIKIGNQLAGFVFAKDHAGAVEFDSKGTQADLAFLIADIKG